MDTLTTWAVLVLTFPTENATARMRAWRALKAKGCAVLRDGTHVVIKHVSPDGLLSKLTNGADRLYRLWTSGIFEQPIPCSTQRTT